jgi:hypothetical protein
MKTTQNSAKYNKTRVCIGDEYDRWTVSTAISIKHQILATFNI